jgi:hypothetical protein
MDVNSPLRSAALVAAQVVLWTACTCVAAFAQGHFQPPSPEELTMKAEPQAPGAPAVILFRDVERDDTGLTAHENDYLRIKILTEEGRKYGNVEIPYFKGSENIVAIKARTIRADGTTANFDGRAFDRTVVKAKGVKYLVKAFSLPDVQVGSIIEYSYTDDLAEYYVFDSHWILSDELFTKKARFSLKPYSSDYENWSVRWSWQFLPPGTAEPKQGPDHIVRLEASNIPAFETEDMMPPENELKARVDFIYSNEYFENADQFWKNFGKKRNDQLEKFVNKKKAMEQAVAQIVSPGDAPEEKLRKIYTRVQQLRNTSYEVSKTEEEEKRAKEKEADNVEDAWKQGYGNGLTINRLYLALVRAAGMEAYEVWAADRYRYFFNPKTMDSNKLTAEVILVKLNGKDLFLDPAAAFTPFGLLPWTETAVMGLRLDKDGGTWIETSVPSSADTRIERSANLKLSADSGDLEGKVKVTFVGMEAARWRVEERNEDEADRKKSLEDELKEYVPAATEVELVNHPDWKSSEPTLVAEFTLKVPGWASAAGRRALVPVGLFSAPERHLFDHQNRVHPIYFSYPSEKRDDITIELPDGWQVSSVPKPTKTDGHVIVFESEAQSEQGRLHLTRQLKVDTLMLETKYYTALRNFFQGVKASDEEQIVLQPGAAHASNQ